MEKSNKVKKTKRGKIKTKWRQNVETEHLWKLLNFSTSEWAYE